MRLGPARLSEGLFVTLSELEGSTGTCVPEVEEG